MATRKQTTRPLEQPTENLSIRLRPSVMRALREASYRRRLDKVEPRTLQAIVEAALVAWLDQEK